MKKLVVAIMVYVDDNWYGQRYRYFYAGPTRIGFETKTEARKYASALKRYVKGRVKERFGDKGKISSEIEIGDINDATVMPTYRYCGAGPSWACTNCEVETEMLVKVERKKVAGSKRLSYL